MSRTPERAEDARAHRSATRRHGADDPDEDSRVRGRSSHHGHGHGHGAAPPSSSRVRTLLAALLIPFALAALAGALVLYPWHADSPSSKVDQGTPVHGTVTAASAGPCLQPGQVRVGEPDADERRCLAVDVRLSDGPASGTTVHQVIPIEPSTPRFSVDDEVVLAYTGTNPERDRSYQIVDYQRGIPLLVLAGLFAIAVVLLGRKQGLAALGSLVLSFVVLAVFVLPAILAGHDPLLVAIVAAALIMFVALYLTHGFSARTSTAVLGTMVSLCLIGVIATVFAAVADLTGLDENTATLISALGHGIDARGLLLGGVVIGALGVLDDVTVSQASSVWELRRANPALGWRALYSSALRIGRDHAASAVNTLFMAYAGAALPVMLYSSISGVGLGSILGSQDIAQEIVRTLAGSIGLVASIPVTTLLAALVASREPDITRSSEIVSHSLGIESAPESTRPAQ